MKYIVKHIPEQLDLKNIKKNYTKNEIWIISLEGIYKHGINNYKLKNIDRENKIHNLSKTIQIVEDNTELELEPSYHIPLFHHTISIMKNCYKFNQIELQVSYLKNNIYDIAIIADNYDKIKKNKDSLISILE